MSDTFHLERFVSAQAAVYPEIVAELRAGQKRTHWMWFIFPQIAGLGRSGIAQHFAISSLTEAKAYLAHPTLGPRLRECTLLATRIEGRSANTIFGSPDDLKFRSSMTLFALADPAEKLFRQALDKFYAGEMDPRTQELAVGWAALQPTFSARPDSP